jgi:AraC-like DNA-binding protein/mannose-6-phosphate isomerase-like protein (cupin superfamily)
VKDNIHRPNTKERIHYIPSKKVEILLHPKLLYAGTLKRSAQWRETPHSHTFLEIIFIKSGNGTVVVNDHTYEVKGGDVIIYNPHVPHNEISSPTDPLEIYFFATQGIRLNKLPENHLTPKGAYELIHTGEQFALFGLYFSNLVKESQNDQHFSKEMTESLTRMILILILRILSIGNEKYIKTNVLYFKAKTYIDEYFAEINSVEELCRQVYISNYYLTHLFRLYGDKTPLQCIIQKKMELAKTLLQSTDFAVGEIALRCGYEDANYFCKVFKAREKVTPLRFRRRQPE